MQAKDIILFRVPITEATLQAVRSAMEAQGVSQTDLCRHMDWKKSRLSQFLKGTYRSIPLQSIQAIEAYLGIDLNLPTEEPAAAPSISGEQEWFLRALLRNPDFKKAIIPMLEHASGLQYPVNEAAINSLGEQILAIVKDCGNDPGAVGLATWKLLGCKAATAVEG